MSAPTKPFMNVNVLFQQRFPTLGLFQVAKQQGIHTKEVNEALAEFETITKIHAKKMKKHKLAVQQSLDKKPKPKCDKKIPVVSAAPVVSDGLKHLVVSDSSFLELKNSVDSYIAVQKQLSADCVAHAENTKRLNERVTAFTQNSERLLATVDIIANKLHQNKKSRTDEFENAQ